MTKETEDVVILSASCGHHFKDVTAIFVTGQHGALADPYTDGTFGGLLFATFNVVFDYPHQRIALIIVDLAPYHYDRGSGCIGRSRGRLGRQRKGRPDQQFSQKEHRHQRPQVQLREVPPVCP